MKLQTLKEYLRNETVKTLIVLPTDENYRQVRQAMSELRKEGVIYVPVGNNRYQKLNPDVSKEREQIEAFVRTQVAHLATQYFNTVKPLKNYVSDAKLKNMIGQLSFMEEL